MSMPGPRLDYSRVPLVGRKAETELLCSVHSKIEKESSTVEAVLIEGESGAGKTFLVESWYREHCCSDASSSTLFCVGKFDAAPSSVVAPYSAFVDAIIDLFQQIQQFDVNDLLRELRARIGEESCILANVFKGIFVTAYSQDGLFSEGMDHSEDSSRSSERQGVAIERLPYLLREFLCVICGMVPRFIMLIEDLQWADDDTLELLQSILLDERLSGFMLVLTCRPNAHEGFISNLEASMSDCRVPRVLHRICLKNIAVEDVNNIVSSLTEQRAETTYPLAELVHEKTGGNCHYIMQFLCLLEQRRMLQYSLVEFRWTWEVEYIRQNMNFSDNVTAIVLEGIKTLSAGSQHMLRIAAYLGASFEVQDVAFIVAGLERAHQANITPEQLLTRSITIHHPDDSSRSMAVLDALHECSAARLVDQQTHSRYKFSHGSIHMAFLSMDEEESEQFSLLVGSIILSLYRESSASKESLLFAAVQTLNQGAPALNDCASMLCLAQLNIDGADQAANKSAFGPASAYLSVGIGLLNSIESPWQTHHELARRIYVKAASIELVCGRHDQAKASATLVLENATCFEEAMDAYITLSTSLRVQGNLEGSRKVLLGALSKYGQQLPERASYLSFLTNSRENKEISKMTPEMILSLRPVSKGKDERMMKLLNLLIVTSYYRHQDMSTLIAAVRRSLSLTLRLGLSKYAPISFAIYAQHLITKGRFDQGCRFGDIAVRLLEKSCAKDNVTIATFFLVAFVGHLKKPLYQGTRLLDRGFHAGVRLGDIEGGLVCASTKVAYQVVIGTPLKDILQESLGYFRLARQSNQIVMAREFLLMSQFIANLCAETDDPFKFDGAFIGEEDLMEKTINGESSGMACDLLLNLETQLRVYMGDWEHSTKIVEEALKPLLPVKGHYMFVVMSLFAGLVWFKEYARTKSRKALRRGNRHCRTLRDFAAKGAINVVPSLWLVEAQKAAAMKKKFREVKSLYEKAIAGLHRTGYRSLEALACEDLSRIALEAGENELASYHMKRSYSLFQDWGALSKVRKLEETYTQLLGLCSKQTASRRRKGALTDSSSSSFDLDGSIKFSARASWWSNFPEPLAAVS